uniref:PARP-type domain-containing protein n=1 Tax=Oryza punctata TaxID=4537 RepID=A0A0E0JIE2_ORYPU
MSTAPAASAAAAAAKATISVEYAKSGRSACKVCSEGIAKGALRLGASARDPRGFDSTKWYHVACFPSSSHPIDPIEKIKGFDSIKEEDREEVRELNKTCKRDHTAVGPTEESSPKKVKASLSSPAAGVAENASISVEYAKSGRSTCKGCSESIAAGALRLGASIRDPRGFDSTKWYHIACFPASTYPAFPVENLKGCFISSLLKLTVVLEVAQNQDRDKLRELEENCKRDGNATDQLNELNLKKEVAHSMEDSKGAGNNLEGVKMLAGDKRAGPVISFSVSDIKKNYKDATLPAHWKVFNTVIFREQDDGLRSSAKIAAFDFDGCLAKTSVRIVGADKWSLLYESIPEKLQILYNDGYKLVIFTNESNIERWNKKRQQAVDSKIGRLNKFIERVFIACGLGKGKTFPDDPFRKPNTGISFYVGDAAGRENDHSDADKEFAKAIGLKFHVPEEYFGEAANI